MVPGCCGPLSRRELLRRAVLLAGAPAAVDGWPDRAAASGAGPVPADLELLTVTDTSLALRWTTGDPARPDLLGRPTPLPADTHLLVRDLRGRPVAEVRRDDATAVHLAEVDGLTPGTTYAVEARSADRVATPRLLARIDPAALPAVLPVDPAGLRRVVDGRHQTSAAPGLVTTLVPPDGPLLAVLALTNDLHVGETASGVLQGDLPPAVRQPAGLPAYPELMARAVVAEARARGADVLLVAGDLTAEAALPDAHAARELLLGFGSQVHAGPMVVGSWLAVRGNHDRVHGGDDTVGAVFGLSRQRLAVADVGGLRVIALDTSTQHRVGPSGQASSPRCGRSCAGTRTGRRSCWATTPSPTPAPPRRWAAAPSTWTPTARAPSRPPTPQRPACSCTTPGTRTGRTAAAARRQRTWSSSRWVRRRNTRAA